MLRRPPLSPISILTAAAVALLTAGCGGGSSTTAAGTSDAGPLAYSQCMQTHGVPFPDPASNGGIDKDKIIALGNGPQFRAAENACLHVMPASGLGPQPTVQQTTARIAGGLRFARCMRDHGFPSFPDPTSRGQLTPQMVSAAGIDLHQRAFLRVGLECAPLSHGLITRAAVERAVNGD